jgi:tetratricopeptide (TPR) repeat protein
LYADALMIQHPWDYWLHNGTPRPWTNTITEILEKVLAQTPQHPGANHYYIHAVEASHTPEKALASADRLGGMMPSVSHMVHMPSHIYIRTGYYEKGTRVNESAVKGYDLYKKLMPETENAQFLYELHNLHMMAANALFLKDYSYAYESALKTQNSIPPTHLEMEAPWGPLIQYIYMTPLIAQVRYSRWDEIIAAPWIKESYANARVIQHWARGMAFIGKGDRKSAQMELANMQQRMTDKSLAVDPIIFNPSIRAANVMESILQGRIAENENKLANAQRDFQHAVDLEDDMLYNEPRDWLLPARHYLAENLIRQKKFAQAEEVLREDLKTNPRNYWATEMLSHMPSK